MASKRKGKANAEAEAAPVSTDPAQQEIPGVSAEGREAPPSAPPEGDSVSGMIAAAVNTETAPDLAAADAAVNAALPSAPEAAPVAPVAPESPATASNGPAPIPGLTEQPPKRTGGRPRTREYDPVTGKPIRKPRAAGAAPAAPSAAAPAPGPSARPATPPPAAAAATPRGKTRDALSGEVSTLQQQLEAERAKVAAYKAREDAQAIDRLAGLIGLAGRVGFNAMANKRGAHWLLTEQEEKEFGAAWALAVAPHAEFMAEYAPIVGAVVVTAGIAWKRLEQDEIAKAERAGINVRPDAPIPSIGGNGTAPEAAPETAPVKDYAQQYA